MPWMVFYQQSSVVEKKLTIDDQRAARLDTAFGAVSLTQIIMAAVLIATAATLRGKTHSGSLDTVQQIAEAITPFSARRPAASSCSVSACRAARTLVATIVVTLTAARTLSEVLGVIKHSLEHEPQEAPLALRHLHRDPGGRRCAGVSGVNLVSLSVGVQVLNALLLPIVLGFLYLLARRPPEPHRLLKGGYAVVAATGVIAAAVIFGVYSGISGLWG